MKSSSYIRKKPIWTGVFKDDLKKICYDNIIHHVFFQYISSQYRGNKVGD